MYQSSIHKRATRFGGASQKVTSRILQRITTHSTRRRATSERWARGCSARKARVYANVCANYLYEHVLRERKSKTQASNKEMKQMDIHWTQILSLQVVIYLFINTSAEKTFDVSPKIRLN